ncbi:MAG: carbohydrate kinase family protein, partial [Chloroflexi bacterium]|nr:carbohydrate kinase family protein [Chloroflexota bacterium]
ELRFADLPVRPDLAVISPNDPAAMVAYVRECHALGIPYLYDPSQQVVRVEGDVLREGIAGCELLVVNDYELGMIERKTGWTQAQVLGQAATLVVTRGEAGATIYANGTEASIPVVPPERLLDPTGVGDAFRGGLLTGLSRGWSWELAGRVGALAATYCLEQVGTQNHSYSRAEFVQRFRQHFHDGGALDALLVADSGAQSPASEGAGQPHAG